MRRIMVSQRSYVATGLGRDANDAADPDHSIIPPDGMLTVEGLRRAVAAENKAALAAGGGPGGSGYGANAKPGGIDTVIVACSDLYGRLVGKRYSADYFLRSDAATKGSHGCAYLFTTDMEPVGFCVCRSPQPFA